jgi:hypothetical protein
MFVSTLQKFYGNYMHIYITILRVLLVHVRVVAMLRLAIGSVSNLSLLTIGDYYYSHNKTMKSKWWPGRDKEWVIGGCTSCIPWPWDLAWLHCFPCPCRLRTVLTMDGSQVTDLLSWAHTYVWEREGSLLFIMGSGSFRTDWLGAGKGGGLSTTLRPGHKCGGLESKFRQGPGPLDRSGIGWSCLCLGYKWGVCFGGTQLRYIGSWIAIFVRWYDLAIV